MVLIIIIGVLLVVGVGVLIAYFSSHESDEEEIDVIEDFKVIKKAFTKYKKENIQKCTKLNYLSKYMEAGKTINYRRYAITPDEKFLIVRNVEKLDCDAYITKIGGNSYKEGSFLYLSFLKFKVSEVEPQAIIRMHPKVDIKTTTSVEWHHEDSVVEGDEIKEVEWEGKEEIYAEKGDYTVRLRVQDVNENWSEWSSITFTVKEVVGVKHISGGDDFVMVVHNSGKVEGFGHNNYGQLGNGVSKDFMKKEVVKSLINITEARCGGQHALARDNKGFVFALGNNEFGQLGLGNKMNSNSAQKIWGLEKVRQISAGKDFSAALLATGAVLTWGRNEYGQLGNDAARMQDIPKRVSGISNVRQISCGFNHMLVLLYDGTVMAWGSNKRGQVGNGFKCERQEPALANVSSIKHVAAGREFSVAVKENGSVIVWGYNNYGQLGLTEGVEVAFPVEVPKLKNIIRVVSKDSFVLALNDIGQVYTWGRYDLKSDECITKPVLIDGLKYVKDIGATATDAYIVTEDGDILTWSSNVDLRQPIERMFKFVDKK